MQDNQDTSLSSEDETSQGTEQSEGTGERRGAGRATGEAKQAADMRQGQIFALSKHVCDESKSREELLDGFGNIALEHLADGFAIDLVEDDGSIKRYATRHRDETKQLRLTVLREKYPLAMTSAYFYPRVIKTGKSQFFQGVTQQLFDRLYPDPEHRAEIKGLNAKSFICTPLISQGRTLGAMTLLITDRATTLTTDDLHIAEELAQQAAKCLDEESWKH